MGKAFGGGGGSYAPALVLGPLLQCRMNASSNERSVVVGRAEVRAAKAARVVVRSGSFMVRWRWFFFLRNLGRGGVWTTRTAGSVRLFM